MGQRATIAFIDTDKSVQLTSVQWSTRLDQTLGHMANEARKANQDPAKVIAGLFRKVTRSYGHVSAVEISSKTDKFFNKNTDKEIGYGVSMSSGQDKNPTDNKFSNRDRVDIYNWHLDGSSIGAIYDMSKPDIIEFFWDGYDYNTDTDMGIKTRKCSIDSLANFYKNVPAQPQKLKKFSFRTY